VGVQISSLPPPDNRIFLLLQALRPSQIVLQFHGFDPSHLASLPPPGSDIPPIPTDCLYVSFSTSTSLAQWSPALHLFDPTSLCFLGDGYDDPNQAPTVFRVAEDDLSFSGSWTRLQRFFGRGQASVPILEGNDGTFPLFQSPASAGRMFAVVSKFRDGRPDSHRILDASDLVSSLSGEVLPDAARKDLYFSSVW